MKEEISDKVQQVNLALNKFINTVSNLMRFKTVLCFEHLMIILVFFRDEFALNLTLKPLKFKS